MIFRQISHFRRMDKVLPRCLILSYILHRLLHFLQLFCQILFGSWRSPLNPGHLMINLLQGSLLVCSVFLDHLLMLRERIRCLEHCLREKLFLWPTIVCIRINHVYMKLSLGLLLLFFYVILLCWLRTDKLPNFDCRFHGWLISTWVLTFWACAVSCWFRTEHFLHLPVLFFISLINYLF